MLFSKLFLRSADKVLNYSGKLVTWRAKEAEKMQDRRRFEWAG